MEECGIVNCNQEADFVDEMDNVYCSDCMENATTEDMCVEDFELLKDNG